MNIVQLTDLHLRPLGQAANRVSESNALTERAFRAVAALDPRPDAVIITGDLTECGLDAEYDVLAGLLSRTLSMPVFVIPGNHDRREVLLRHFPEVKQVDGFVQYAVDEFPVRIVMLDTVVPGAGHGALSAQQLAWLDTTLAAVPNKPTLIGMHHPPFLCGIEHMDTIALQDREAFAAVIAKHPQVSRIVCGHHHRPIFVPMGHAVASIAPSVAHQVELELRPGMPGLFVMEPPAYHLHRWTPETGIVTHMGYVDTYPGPYPFLTDPDYPGKPQK
jgi:3',5'-cyclic AMP phosphodiesterase CpdA